MNIKSFFFIKSILIEVIIFPFQCISNSYLVQRSHLFYQKKREKEIVCNVAKNVFVYAHRQKAKRKKKVLRM